ncbi:hypothetical protein Gotur_027963 [Gossypium turneri]
MELGATQSVDLPYHSTIKIHRLMCLELKKLVDSISPMFAALESARPGCTLGMRALCSLQSAMDKANLLIQLCSESSKLYLAITGKCLLLRCDKIRKTLEICMIQVREMVPSVLAAKFGWAVCLDPVRLKTAVAVKLVTVAVRLDTVAVRLETAVECVFGFKRNCSGEIAGIIDELRRARFQLEASEHEAGAAIIALLEHDKSASASRKQSEIEALRLSSLRLSITSPFALLIEKRSIKKLLGSVQDTNPNKRKVLTFLLYLLKKHGKLIWQLQPKKTEEESLFSLMKEDGDENVETSGYDFFLPITPDQIICPISKRLLYDPVIIASGQTFERVWIEKWFNEGNQMCPVTNTKLMQFSLTPNLAMKALISKWLLRHGINVPQHVKPVPSLLSLRQPSSCSIASFGTSVLGFPLEIGSVTLDSAVQNVKGLLEDNDKAQHLTFSNSHVVPVIKFLKDANDLSDVKMQKDGAEVLLAILSGRRIELPPCHEDVIYLLASLLDSEITRECLAILEILSWQQYYKSRIVACGILPSILKLLDTTVTEFNMVALKILWNLSNGSNVGYHITYLGYIPKLVSFLEDPNVAGYCVGIMNNIRDIEEARIEAVEAGLCTSIATILESSKKEEQEVGVELLLFLCYENTGYCKMIMTENVIQALSNISVNGSSKGSENALTLLELMDWMNASQCSRSGSRWRQGNSNVSSSTSNNSRLKISSYKALGRLRKKLSRVFLNVLH